MDAVAVDAAGVAVLRGLEDDGRHGLPLRLQGAQELRALQQLPEEARAGPGVMGQTPPADPPRLAPGAALRPPPRA